jgi:hypothetical protein
MRRVSRVTRMLWERTCLKHKPAAQVDASDLCRTIRPWGGESSSRRDEQSAVDQSGDKERRHGRWAGNLTQSTFYTSPEAITKSTIIDARFFSSAVRLGSMLIVVRTSFLLLLAVKLLQRNQKGS